MSAGFQRVWLQLGQARPALILPLFLDFPTHNQLFLCGHWSWSMVLLLESLR